MLSQRTTTDVFLFKHFWCGIFRSELSWYAAHQTNPSSCFNQMGFLEEIIMAVISIEFIHASERRSIRHRLNYEPYVGCHWKMQFLSYNQMQIDQMWIDIIYIHIKWPPLPASAIIKGTFCHYHSIVVREIRWIKLICPFSFHIVINSLIVSAGMGSSML